MNTQTTSILFLDSSVDNYEFLLKGIVPAIKPIVLEQDRDQVEQITQILSQHPSVESVHIVSHGSPGCLYLGNTQLSLSTLQRYTQNLQTWFSSKRDRSIIPSLLLYGCNVACGDAGGEFIAKLHQLTGANIAASTSLTGSGEKGGNWNLEVAVGKDLPIQKNVTLGFQQHTLASYASVLAPGDIDTTFGTGGKVTTDFGSSDSAYSVMIQSDGKIVVVGSAYNNSSSQDFALARYNPNGTLDTTFGNGGKINTDFLSQTDWGRSAAVQPDGKIVVGGVAWNGKQTEFALARYNSNGTLDTSFGNGGKINTFTDSKNEWGNYVAIQLDGKIVIGGYVNDTQNANSLDFALLRYNPDGKLDTSFGNGGSVVTPMSSGQDSINSITIQPNGKIVVAGAAINSSGNDDFALVRYNTDGTLDTSFGNGGKVTTNFGVWAAGYSVAIQSDGKIVTAGAANGDFALTRYNINGSLDTNFGNGGKIITPISSTTDVGLSVAIQPNSKIVVAGFVQNGESRDFALAAYNPDGTPDTSFGNGGKVITPVSGGYDGGRSVALQSDGRIIVAGGGNGDFVVARYEGTSNTVSTSTTSNITYHKLATSDFSQDWSNGNLINTDDDWSGVPSIRGYQGDALVSSLGTNPQLVLADGSRTPIDVNANQSDPNTLNVGGVAEFALSNPTIALRGSSTADAPHLVLYLDTTERQNLRLSYILQDIDTSRTRNVIQPVAVQYRIGDTGEFINLPTAFVPDASNFATSSAPYDAREVRMSVLLPPEVNNQAQVQVRLITTDAPDDDEWIGIDDIKVASTAISANQPPAATNDSYMLSANTSLTTAVATTALTLDSDRGNYIGQSDYYSYTPANGNFKASRNSDNGVSINFSGPSSSSNWWYLDFAAANDALLTPGTYIGATRYPFQASTAPGLNVSGSGRGYNTLTGEFVVNQVVYGANQEIASFDATFRENGDGDPATESFRGRIQYRATPSNRLPGVLTNDTDTETTALKATLVTGPTNGSLVFNPDGSFSYTPNPGFKGIDAFTYRANDSIADSNEATVTLNVGSNEAPIIRLPGTNPTYIENSRAISIDPSATVTDPDSLNFDTGKLVVRVTAGSSADDRLAIRNEGTETTQINLDGRSIKYGNVQIGNFSGGIGTENLVIDFNSNATPTAAQALLRNINYANVSENPKSPVRTVELVLTDGDGGTSPTLTKQINVTAVNDAPTVSNIDITGNTNTNISFSASQFTSRFSDPDGDRLSRIQITSLPEKGTLKLNGTSVANNQEISLTDFGNLVFTPNPDFTGQTSFTWNGFDGKTYAATNATVAITVKAVNIINGTAGSDNLRGTSGIDRIIGGAGNDIIYGFGEDDFLDGGSGDDYLQGQDGNDNLIGDVGFDRLSGGAGNDILDGGDGVDDISESADVNFTLTNNQLVGLGTDTLSNIERVNLNGGSSDNAIDASAFTLGSVSLSGGVGQDRLFGGSGNDYFYGHDGSDNISGGAGNDSLSGGAGNDSLNGGDGSDSINESANVNFTLTNNQLVGLGTDTLSNIERASLSGGSSDNVIDASAFTLGSIYIYGGAGHDNLTSGSGNDYLFGQDGNDILNGGDGIDEVNESGDVNFTLTNNQLVGLGNDTLSNIERFGLRGGNSDNIIDASAFTLGSVYVYSGAGHDSLSGGSGNDHLLGQDGNDNLSGGAGNDYLYGDKGDDTFNGGMGNDTYNVDSTADIIIEQSNAGTDSVTSSISWTLADNLEDLTLSGNSAIAGTGNALNNTITGSYNVSNNLFGLEGNDRLVGNVKDDLLDGDIGDDTLIGNSGNDTLIGNFGNDSFTGSAGVDIFVLNNPNQGIDTIADFVVIDDTLRVSASGFGGGLTAGASIKADQLLTGSGAVTPNSATQRFIYNTSTSVLFFDADGNQTEFGTVQIATLSNKALISADDIYVTN